MGQMGQFNMDSNNFNLNPNMQQFDPNSFQQQMGNQNNMFYPGNNYPN
jgi:hypothetical protein